MPKNYYHRLDNSEPNHRGLATLYVKRSTLYFRIPDKLGLGRNKFVSTGLPNRKDGIATARTLLLALNNDILLGQFDVTLERYLPQHRKVQYKEQVKLLKGNQTPVKELWKAYCLFKENKVKESTLFYLTDTIGKKIDTLPDVPIHDGEQHYKFLLDTTTKDYARRIITKLSSLFKWCSSKGIIEGKNPYPAILENIKHIKYTPKASPLSDDVIDYLFSEMSKLYIPLSQFILYTGCRPSEAIGLTWDNVKDDVIILGSSVVRKSGKVFVSVTSKNNKVRPFPLTARLNSLLLSLPKNNKYVFHNTLGKPFDYSTYYKHYKSILNDSTPYSLRDTFITKQIERGVPIATIAAWVDNSVKMIETTYYKPSGKILPE